MCRTGWRGAAVVHVKSSHLPHPTKVAHTFPQAFYYACSVPQRLQRWLGAGKRPSTVARVSGTIEGQRSRYKVALTSACIHKITSVNAYCASVWVGESVGDQRAGAVGAITPITTGGRFATPQKPGFLLPRHGVCHGSFPDRSTMMIIREETQGFPCLLTDRWSTTLL